MNGLNPLLGRVGRGGTLKKSNYTWTIKAETINQELD